VAPLTGFFAVDGVSRDVGSIADTHALPALVVLLVAAAVLAWWLRRSGRTDLAFGALFASLGSICLIVAVTLLRDGWPQQFSANGLTDWSSAGFDRLRSDPFGSSQFILNLVLFIPAGVAWTWMTKRPAVVAPALIGGSILIEAVQAITGLGAPDVADLVANSIGALVGVGSATLVALATRQQRTERRLSPRKRAIVAAAVVGVGSVTVILVLVGADRHQRTLRHELQTAFAGTTKADIDRWNADSTMLTEVFDAVSVFADGTQYAPDEVEVRYPASFFGLHRCVFVIWTPATVRFELGSGDACTDFIG
jgi:glycopeptide antibiotics resistance protein